MAETDVAPLDGGWGWFIVLGACIIHFLVSGWARAFGIMFNPIVAHFDTSATAVALIDGTCNAIRYFGSPITSDLSVRLNIRLMVMLGGCMVSIGFLTSAFVPNPFMLLLTYSMLVGVGCCCAYAPTYVILNQYFEKKRGKALGFGTFGTGLGVILLSDLMVLLLNAYGYSGAMMVLSAIMLHICVSGALYRPIENNRRATYQRLPDTNEPNAKEIDENRKNTSKQNGPYGAASNKLKTFAKISQANEIETENGTYGSKKTLKIVAENSSTTETQELQSMWEKFKTKIEVFKNLTYVLYFTQLFFLPLCVTSYLLWLPPYAFERGESANKGVLLVSAAGFSDMIGRLIGGFIFDISFIQNKKRPCHTVLALAMSCCVMGTALATDYYSIMVTVIVYGLVGGSFQAQLTSIAAHVAPKHLMAQAVGFVIFGRGLLVFLGPVIGGAMIDHTGTCKWNFFLNGGLFGFFSFLFLMDYCFRKQPMNIT